MINTRFYLDTRGSGEGKPAPLKLSISKQGQSALLHLNIRLLPSQWDKAAGKIINHPNKSLLNGYIVKRKQDVDVLLLKLLDSGKICGKTAVEVKRIIQAELSSGAAAEDDAGNLFAARFLAFANGKRGGTKEVYIHTYRRMEAYMPDRLAKLSFEDITKEWLAGFDNFLAKTSSQNTRSIHFRNIRAVFNDAIDDEITRCYPFRRFKIRTEKTAKRSLTVEQLRAFFDAPTEPHSEKYLDAFKLIFFLIGINAADLCALKEVRDGRVEYHRAKTHRLYSIKVEPEAQAILDKYRGERYLLPILDRYASPTDYLRRLNRALKKIGPVSVGKKGKKSYQPLFPEITTYWARHTWATIAASLDIPKETIAAALGHGGNTVTDIYIDFDRKKIDEANRRVIDWVLYGKRGV